MSSRKGQRYLVTVPFSGELTVSVWRESEQEAIRAGFMAAAQQVMIIDELLPDARISLDESSATWAQIEQNEEESELPAVRLKRGEL